MNSTGLAKAIESAGGIPALARQLGITRQAIYAWQRGAQIPAERAVEIERTTGVARSELRPDLFGEAA